VKVYLEKFDYYVRRLLRLDPQIDDEDIRMAMFIQFSTAKKPLALSPDGERYMSLEIWVARQVRTNIATYAKLSAALKEKYAGEGKTSLELSYKIDKMHPNWKKTILKEFFADVDALMGSTTIQDGLLIKSLNEKLPIEVKEELRCSRGA
jgi:hypothetical protein